MNSIKLPINFEGSKGDKTLDSLFENQALYSCINKKNAIEITELSLLRKPKTLLISDKLIEINHVVLLDFYINNVRFSDEFMVVPNLKECVIFRTTTLRKWRMDIDVENNKLNAKNVYFRI